MYYAEGRGGVAFSVASFLVFREFSGVAASLFVETGSVTAILIMVGIIMAISVMVITVI